MATRFLRYSPQAQNDVLSILQYSRVKFGTRTSRRYLMLLDQAMEDLLRDAHRFGRQAQFELQDGLYFYHLKYSKRSVSSKTEKILHPRHIIAYRLPSATELHIIRILHERMEFNQQNYPIEYLN